MESRHGLGGARLRRAWDFEKRNQGSLDPDPRFKAESGAMVRYGEILSHTTPDRIRIAALLLINSRKRKKVLT